ncbi:gag-pol polyprotein [Tanacetum coccineum]
MMILMVRRDFDGVGVNAGMENKVKVNFDDVDMGSDVGVNTSKVFYQVNAKESMVSNVSQGSGDRNDEKLEKLSNVNKVSDDMPIPFSENVILNHGGNKTSVVRNAGSLGKDSEERVNNVWPKLNEINNKGSGGNGNGRNVGDIDMPDGTNGRKPLSFISAIQGISFSGSNKLSRIPMRMIDKGENVANMDPVIKKGSKRWDMTLIGYFVGLKMSYYEISSHLRRMWRSHQLAKIITNDNGFYFLKFISEEGLNFVLENGPWLVNGKPFFAQKWEAGFCIDKPEPTRVPLWVKIMNVPLEAWNTHGINRLASFIGNPIIMDRIIMCKNREMTEEEKDKVAKSKMNNVSRAMESNTRGNEEWQDVRIPNRNGASTSKNRGQQSNGYVFRNRGRFNGRGRGGMNGRGGMIGRGSVYQRGSNDGNVMKCVLMKDRGQMVDNVQVIKDKNSSSKVDKGKNVINDTNGCERKVADKNVVNVKNSFMVIADGIVEIGGDEWMQMKKRLIWLCTAKIKTNMIKGLKWRISKLKKDISYVHNNVSRVANKSAKKLCVGVMKKEGITRNQAFLKFETLVGMKVNDTIKKTFEGVMDCMQDEVAGETSGSAKFMTKDEVSNVVEGNDVEMQDQVMHFMVMRIRDDKVLMGDYNVILNFNENSNGIGVKSFGFQDFRDCVDLLSLEDVKIMGMFLTWIQKRNDPSAGILKKLDRILGNHHFVSDYPESYANFLPFNVSDHAHTILVMLDGVRKKNRAFRFMNYLTEKKGFIDAVKDNWKVLIKGYAMFVLARRLKFLKKHLRDLNRKNGDVFMKSKMLKEELARVQDALGKDPSNTSLREEELIYAKAYKKAALDKELILKVIKNMIEGACDDAGNMLYGEHMVNKFVDHFKNFIRHADKVYLIDDPGSLFIKKLDAVTAVYLIKLVTNEEVKTALFNIEDNKASRPDGYTSKFFKFAWKIVGEDVCSTVKEFFTSGKLLVLRRGLDKFSLSSGFHPRVLPIKYLGVPMVSKILHDSDCKVLIEVFKKRIRDLWNRVLSFCCWKHLLDLRDKIRNFVLVKVGNGMDCNIWFDKWHPHGPLCKLINHKMLEQANLCVKTKIVNMIDGNEWKWPIDWNDRFGEVTNVPVPNLVENVKDKLFGWIKRVRKNTFLLRKYGRMLELISLRSFGMIMFGIHSAFLYILSSCGLLLGVD